MPLTDQQDPSHQHDSAFRKLLPLTTVGIIIAALYAGWTLYSRHEANERALAEAQAKQQEAQKAQNDAIFQHGELTFTTFEASDAVVRPGQSTQLCYGVVNAKTVKIDPPVEALKPTIRHCMDIAPKKTTTYTITADNGAGQTKSLSLTVRVK
ncbi:MAG: hypothetical protein JO061_06930 [Acidobacteriaceae bacterium]|nr:hypothetical protein [Acidobacteriaceae bacterium]